MARGHHFRASGGKVPGEDGKMLDYTNESNVAKEAKERKDGGKAKKHVAMDGMKTKHMRLDRPGRKRGGAVGADATPLSSAARVTQASAHKAGADELAKG